MRTAVLKERAVHRQVLSSSVKACHSMPNLKIIKKNNNKTNKKLKQRKNP